MQLPPLLLENCVTLLREVGAFQLQHFRAMPQHTDVSSNTGKIKSLRETVSFVDVESETTLQHGLLPLIEGAGFYGEENGQSGCQNLVWIVDPLDGTTNYLSGLSQFSISIALVANGQPQFGVVYHPYSDDFYSAVRGQGACFNGTPCRPTHPDIATKDALFMTGFPYRSPDVAKLFFHAAAEVLTLGRGIRRSGSAALDIADLSMGWLQGFWETDLQPYDVAAGLLLLEENGVLATNQHGQPFNMFADRLLVAALPNVHPTLLKTIATNYGAIADSVPH